MDDHNENQKTIKHIAENSGHPPGEDDRYKQKKKALMVDKDGFVKEIGEGSWRRYNPHDDQ